MADFFKGLAGGFGTGLQFGQAIRQRRMEDDLAQAPSQKSLQTTRLSSKGKFVSCRLLVRMM